MIADMSVLTAPLAATLVAICAPHVLYAGVWFAPHKFMKASRKMFSKSVDPVDTFASYVALFPLLWLVGRVISCDGYFASCCCAER
jgi:hypothetical protein